MPTPLDPIQALQHHWKTLQQGAVEVLRNDTFFSKQLRRKVTIDVFLPIHYKKDHFYPVLYLNDGQDMTALDMQNTLTHLQQQQLIQPCLVVAIHAANRIQEYGTANTPDYAGRGSRAAHYTTFLLLELMPIIQNHFQIKVKPEQTAIAGFSLSGLSAFDIAWKNAHIFHKVGVFSGSFWWRSRAYEDGYTDADRIAHKIVKYTHYPPNHLQIWLQTGTKDEENDRDKDGIIDSIGDTLHLIDEIKRKNPMQVIQYVEIENGEHNQKTWKEAMYFFLQWAFSA
jgi:enterochelin esterase-like enzyme